jgi:L,D-transpeptidase YbiS
VGRRLRDETHIVVDTRANKLYLKKGLSLLWEADCSVGKGGRLIDPKTGRRWEFVTPRGRFEVRNKIEKPLWVKPDWAFVETGEQVPPPGDPARKVEGELGGYVLNLGDGYLIHGTKNEQSLGRPASHGCVRLGAENLKRLYETVPVGTPVYIY